LSKNKKNNINKSFTFISALDLNKSSENSGHIKLIKYHYIHSWARLKMKIIEEFALQN